MRNLLAMFLASLAIPFLAHNAEAAEVASPSGDIRFIVEASPSLSYRVEAFGKPVLLSSAMNVSATQLPGFDKQVEIVDVSTRQSDTTWKPVVPGRRSTIRDHYNEMTCRIQGVGGKGLTAVLRVRAFDDGVAFRYELPKQGWQTKFESMAEATEFSFPTDARCWAVDYGSYQGHQEAEFQEMRLSGIRPDGFVGLPLLVELDKDLYVALTEAALIDHGGMYLRRKAGDPGKPVTLVNHLAWGVKGEFPHTSPWRMLMIAHTPLKFFENDMLLNLNEPCALKDTSWIKPGMMAWDNWWSGNVRMDTATIKQYIQLAADMGWPYQLIDWEWYGSAEDPNADITKVIPAVDMPEVLRFAKSKGVRCWVWLHWTNADRGDAYLKAFPLYEKWGIAGVKIDFMQREDQEMVNWYRKIAKKAAEHHLMVDFHGAYKPTGDRRTYPNLLTREGVQGNEWNKWTEKVTPAHKVKLAYTRNLLGEMDFTPGGFHNRGKGMHKGATPTEVQGTRAGELALFVVYESPLTCACDSPDSYKNQPGADFLKVVPTTWDETIGVAGDVGHYIVMAKRKGDEWFLGTITDWDSRKLSIPLDFLGEGAYQATIWRDADDADKNAEHLVTEEKTFSRTDTFTANLAPGGGAVVRFVPAAKKKAAKPAE